MLAALTHGRFAALFAAQSASSVGNYAYIAAIAAVLVESGADASRLGLVLAAEALAVVLVALPAGVLADRYPRRRMMIAADATRTAGIVALILAGGDAPLALLLALTFVVGSGEALFQPAYRGLLPRVLPDEHLQAGNALSSLSQQLSLFIGPGLAGAVIAIAGPAEALGLAGAMFTLSWIGLLRAPDDQPAAGAGTRSVLDDAAEGLRALRDRPWIAWVIAMSMIHLLFAIAPWEILAPLVAEEEYGSVAIYGWMLAAFGGGAVLGAVVGSRVRSERPGAVAVLALIPFSVLLTALALEAPLGALIAVLVLAGAGEAVFDILWTTGMQRDVPDELLSRVFSLDWFGSLALLPVGLALTGPAVDELGREPVLLFGAFVALATLLPLLASDSVRRFSSRPAEG